MSARTRELQDRQISRSTVCLFLFLFLILLLGSTQTHWLTLHGRLSDPGEVLGRLVGVIAIGGLATLMIERWLLTRLQWLRQCFVSDIKREILLGSALIMMAGTCISPERMEITLAMVLVYWMRGLYPGPDFEAGDRGPVSLALANRVVTWAIFLTAICIVYLRAPELFHTPRFWAEDGRFSFVHFYSHREWYELLTPWEYYRLVHNVTAYFTVRIFSLEDAPLGFALASGLITLVPVGIVVFGRSPYWDSLFKKTLCVALYFLVPFSAETWLNLNGTAYILSFASVLILLSESIGRARIPYRIVILLAGLTGVLSCLLAPLFGVRAWKSGLQEHRIQFLLLVGCAVIQLAVVFYTNVIHQDGTHMRVTPPSAQTIVLVGWLRTLATIISIEWAAYLRGLFGSAIATPALYHQYALFFGLLWVAVLGFFAKYVPEIESKLLITYFVILTVFSIYFGIGAGGNLGFIHLTNGMRYFYIPSVILSMILLLPLLRPKSGRRHRLIRYVCSVLACLILQNGIKAYGHINVFEPDWPRWRLEVAKWRVDPDYKLKIWPRKWRIALPPKGLDQDSTQGT